MSIGDSACKSEYAECRFIHAYGLSFLNLATQRLTELDVFLMSELGNSQTLNRILRESSALFYFLSLCLVIVFVSLGVLATANLKGEEASNLHSFGAAIYKYPLANRYLIVSGQKSELRTLGIMKDRLHSINNCKASEFSRILDLYACAKVENSDSITVVTESYGSPRAYQLPKLDNAHAFSLNWWYWTLDTVMGLIALCLSLLLFTKARRFLSGYLISLALLMSVCESQFFYMGTHIFNAVNAESLRLSVAFVAGPLGLFFFPKAFDKGVWRSIPFALITTGILATLITYHLFSNQLLNFQTFLYSVSITLLMLIAHFVLKYRIVLNTRERKQVLTMLLSVAFGLALYIPLITYGGVYGFLIGRYILAVSIGFGVLFALMRYGLWQVETLISKSATLSLLSIVAFSAWAGLDQGMQALLNQTIGLSNKVFTAFLAAAISSLFAVPAYNFISKSCDAFFNKDLYQLKRLLSKDILVLAEIQTLEVFVQQLSEKLLSLSGAYKLHFEFIDYNRRAAPVVSDTAKDVDEADKAIIREESFDYKIDGILSVGIALTFADRRINREIKDQLEDSVDEIARALASCSRWNHLETANPSKPKPFNTTQNFDA